MSPPDMSRLAGGNLPEAPPPRGPRERGAACFRCGGELPDSYARMMDGRGACGRCVAADTRLEAKVFRWVTRSLEEGRP